MKRKNHQIRKLMQRNQARELIWKLIGLLFQVKGKKKKKTKSDKLILIIFCLEIQQQLQLIQNQQMLNQQSVGILVMNNVKERK